MFLGSLTVSSAALEPSRRDCLPSLCPHQPPRVLPEAAGRSRQDWPCQPDSLAAGGGGLLAGLSKMAGHRIQDPTLSKSHGALQWKDPSSGDPPNP